MDFNLICAAIIVVFWLTSASIYWIMERRAEVRRQERIQREREEYARKKGLID